MPLTKFKFNPGVYKDGTQYTDNNAWYDSDKIRFRGGKPEKIGGWQRISNDTFKGTCRALHNWQDLAGTDYMGVGTHLKYYIELGGSYNDITPIRKTSTNSITFSATNGSSTLTVTDSSHGALNGDFVTISGAVSLGGNVTAAVLNQEYQIDLVLTANTYNITAKDTSGDTVTANSSDSGNGGSGVDGSYQVNTGTDSYTQSTGWGAGTWGRGTWSSSATSGRNLRLWTHDNYGEDLIMAPRADNASGGVFYWDSSSGVSTRGIALSAVSGASDAPTLVNQIMVSEEARHVIAFGSNPVGSTNHDQMLIRWSDAGSAVDWTPTAVNSAGGQRISSGSKIVGAAKARGEIIVWTDAGMHSMQYIGGDFVFSFRQITEGPSLIGPNAAVNEASRIFWMDRGNFWYYDGAHHILDCTVLDYIFSDINLSQTYKVFGGANADFSEVWWFYPSADSSEIDRYVIYNYKENLWSVGSMVRTAWSEAPTRNVPVAAGYTSKYLYNHETTKNDDGSAMTAYIESGDIDLDDIGDRYIFISKIIPDLAFSGTGTQEVSVSIKGRDYPFDSLSTLSTSTITNSTQQAFIRGRARQTVVRIESSNQDMGWRLGDMRFELRADGRR
jgi:hypothetical protein